MAQRQQDVARPSASSLLVTILGEFVLPLGPAYTQTLTAELAALGVGDKAARQAIGRLADRGWLDAEKVGRRTRWHLTTWATELLEVGATRIYQFGQPRAWDGRWVLLLASVPEAQRRVRYRLATGLAWAGFGSLGQGTWISPWVDRQAEAAELVGDVEGAAVFRAELGDVGDPVALAARAWDLDEVCEDYRAFLADTPSTLVELVDRWRRFPLVDPDLPDDLLPHDWPGRAAARRFADTRTALIAEAHRRWRETDHRYDERHEHEPHRQEASDGS